MLPTHKCYCEPFAGSAAVFFNKPPSKAEVINDLDEELVNMYRVIQTDVHKLARFVARMPHSRALFARLIKENPPKHYRVQRAARFWYLQKSCYGGRVRGKTFGYSRTDRCRQHPIVIAAELKAVAERLHRVTVENLPWHDVVRRYDSDATVFYCDPPYVDYRFYKHNFGMADHEALANALRSIRGRFILSYNDHEDVRRLFSWATIIEINVGYGIGKGTRHGRELLITNIGHLEAQN